MEPDERLQLSPAGGRATPEQELAYALATAVAVLDDLRDKVPADSFPEMVGRISFFVNAGIRFVTELCKMRAFTELWDEITRDRYGIADEKYRRFRYGVQVNSLGLTEQQPENNVYRILLEMLAVTLSKNARARAGAAARLERGPGPAAALDQQWSLRMQQILAYETDLLEYGDLFDGNPVIAAKVETLKQGARDELALLDQMGGAIAAIDYMKARTGRIERGPPWPDRDERDGRGRRQPLAAGRAFAADGGRWRHHGRRPAVEADQVGRLAAWRAERDASAVEAALAALRRAAQSGANIMGPSIAAARAGVTTGEWAGVMRAVHGEYRGPTGVSQAPSNRTEGLEEIRDAVDAVSARLGRRLKFLVGKPGLDGHSNGAEQIAFRARDCGMDITYEGIRLTPEEIVARAREQDVHVVGLSILSGSHLPLIEDLMARMQAAGMGHVPVIVGGIIPDDDAAA